MNDDREARLLARFNDAQERILERISAIEATLQSIDDGFMTAAKALSALSNIDERRAERIERISQRVDTLEVQSVTNEEYAEVCKITGRLAKTVGRLGTRVGALEDTWALGVRR